MSSIFMGIDPSLTSTGLIVLRDEEMLYHKALSSKRKGLDRLIELREAVSTIATRFRPTSIVIEGYAFGASQAHAHELGELGGVIRVDLYENGFRPVDVPPARLKKFTTGKGNAKKELMLLAVHQRWHVAFGTSDEADAYALARVAQALAGEGPELTAFQREVIADIKKAG
ncbi:MAG: crossover junction endodeoxyribonuclease RuvC [Symbiobacteriia bacterium]